MTPVCLMWFHEFFHIKIAVQRPAADVDMYIVLVFIGVVSLGYDNTTEWFLMAKLQPAKNRFTSVISRIFCEELLSISVSGF